MIARLALSAALAAGLAVSASGADAAPTPVLDGKKTKVITFTAVAPPQSNDVTATMNDLDDVPRTQCEMPLCASKDFIYKPAKGVKATALAFESSWTVPVGVDVDLYIGVVDKHGDSTDIGHCAAGAGNHERVYMTANNFKPGKKYRMVAYFYRTANDTVTTTVIFNGSNRIPTTVPAAAEAVYPVNCGL